MKLRLEIENKVMKGEAQWINGDLWVHSDGRTFIFEDLAAKAGKRKKSAKIATGSIESPMPGKVTKLLKMLGERVSVGDSLIVMEAMKMEYTLKADVDGQIESIEAKAGEQVPLGKVLVKIKRDNK